jgi:hypothetical protein
MSTKPRRLQISQSIERSLLWVDVLFHKGCKRHLQSGCERHLPPGAVDILSEMEDRIYLDRALIFRLLRFSLKKQNDNIEVRKVKHQEGRAR